MAGQRNTPRSYLRVWSPSLGSCLIESPFVHTFSGLEMCTIGARRSGGYLPPSLLSQTPLAQYDIQWLYFDLFHLLYVLRTVTKKKIHVCFSKKVGGAGKVFHNTLAELQLEGAIEGSFPWMSQID